MVYILVEYDLALLLRGAFLHGSPFKSSSTCVILAHLSGIYGSQDAHHCTRKALAQFAVRSGA